MITVYKYPFPVCNPNSIAIVELPQDAEIIRLDTEGGHPFLWAIVDTEKPLVNHRFFLHKTGSNMSSTVEALEFKETMYKELMIKDCYLGRFAIWAEMELMLYVFDGGEV